jgi:hypothetical protein
VVAINLHFKEGSRGFFVAFAVVDGVGGEADLKVRGFGFDSGLDEGVEGVMSMNGR